MVLTRCGCGFDVWTCKSSSTLPYWLLMSVSSLLIEISTVAAGRFCCEGPNMVFWAHYMGNSRWNG